jgi:L-ascorbate metabolism protein UlaG (beta-lactamase superfamily)
MIRAEPAPLPVKRREGRPARPELHWLGQAGFLVETPQARFLIDPYLSDSLAQKYKGTAKPHIRMAPAPVDPAALEDIDFVIATHGHTDHLDPGTLGPIAAANPRCSFIVPGSCAELARSRGVPPSRLVEAEAFRELSILGLSLHPLPSAHEELGMDGRGRHLALGYVIQAEGFCLYHPGDCAPYAGLADNLAPFRVDLALLPVNGRDAARTAAGILGNFSLEEAVALAAACGFGASLGHHFGLFDFNTIDEAAAAAYLAALVGSPPFALAALGLRYTLITERGR